jgi:adenosylcobinamide-phosphate synthase
VLGCLADFAIGDPHGIPHPVVAIGRLIAALDKFLVKKADGDRKKALIYGHILCLSVILTTGIITALIIVLSYTVHTALGVIIEAVLTCYILAARSLSDESLKVFEYLKTGDLTGARGALSMIVGRDTDKLSEEGIIKASVETVAENTSDGVIAPLLYTIIGGPILGMLYKAVNTMDSMVGYRNEKYEYFGKAAAKLDDIVNYGPSRLSALLMIAATAILSVFTHERRRKRGYYVNQIAYSVSSACRIWIRDRRKHLSPNSAQTESACAGALGIRLGGSSYYGGVLVDKPYIGDPIRHIEAEDIHRMNGLMSSIHSVYTRYSLR